MKKNRTPRQRRCPGLLSSLILFLLVHFWHPPSQALGSSLAAYAGLSPGLQKIYQVSYVEDGVEVSKGRLRITVLPPQKLDNQEVIPVKIFAQILSRENRMNWTYIDYLRLSAERLLLVKTKYPDDRELHVKDKIILQAPLEAGAAWTTGAYEKTVAATIDSIQVPAGVFHHCLRLKTTRNIEGRLVYEETAWYAPEAGEIKNIITYPLEGTKITTQLLALKQQARKKGAR